MNGYDAWLTYDKELDIREACAEGNHKMSKHWGRCVHCGEEDENFDPDREADRRREEQDEREIYSQWRWR